MIQVKNNKIVQYFLPDNLKELSGEELKKDGWLSVEEKKPEYDPETELLLNTKYEILNDKVVKHYGVVKIDGENSEVERDTSLPFVEKLTTEEEILFESQYQTILLEMGGM